MSAGPCFLPSLEGRIPLASHSYSGPRDSLISGSITVISVSTPHDVFWVYHCPNFPLLTGHQSYRIRVHLGPVQPHLNLIMASLVVQTVKNPPANAGDLGLIPEVGRSPGEGNGSPLQYSCLEIQRDRGAWWTRQSLWSPKESDMTERLNNSNLIISVKTLFFQTRSHSQVPGVQISTCVSGGHNSAPNTMSFTTFYRLRFSVASFWWEFNTVECLDDPEHHLSSF